MPKIPSLDITQKKDLAYFILIALLFVYPIIHANVYFADDLNRIMTGSTNWEKLGRPLASLVLFIGSGSSLAGLAGLVDIAPLTQIVSAIFLALAAFSFNEYLKRETGQPLFWAAALIIVNPFFLYNLSYRYDSLGMAMGLLFATWAFYLPFRNGRASLISIFLLIGCLSLYQPDANFFIGLTAIEILVYARHKNFHQTIQRLFLRMFQFIVAYSLYYLTIAQIFVKHSGEKRSNLIEINASGGEYLLHNSELFIAKALSFLTPTTTFYFIIAVILALAYFTKYLVKTGNMKLLIVMLPAAVLVYIVSLFGPMILLKSPLISARAMPSLYLITILFVLMASFYHTRYARIAWIPLFIALGISYQYGVVLKNQRDYDENLLTLVQYDLLNNKLTEHPIFVLGSGQRAPHAEKIIKNTPFIGDSISTAGGWAAVALMKENGLHNTQFLWSGEMRARKDEFFQDVCIQKNTLITSNPMYSIISLERKTFVLLSVNKKDYCASV